jgi:hypothetical protein
VMASNVWSIGNFLTHPVCALSRRGQIRRL